MRIPVRLSCCLVLFALSVVLNAQDQDTQTGASKLPPDLINRLENGVGEPVKIVCFGDSVTGLYYHTGGLRTYTDMLGIALQQLCPKAKVEMINAGISGHTTVNALARIEKDVLARKPDIVTVMFGLNDLGKGIPLEDYAANLGRIADQCAAAGAEVVLCTPNSVITTKARPFEELVKYCQAMREVAALKGVLLCDTFSAFEAMRADDPLAWGLTLSDEIHPNMAGHKFIARQIAATLSGRTTSLSQVGPSQPAIGKTLTRLAEGKPVKVLAMPPFDKKWAEAALRSVASDAGIEIIPWSTASMSLQEIRTDASQRVRKLKPDLVLIATSRDAKSPDRDSFIYDQYWLANYALSFGAREWDVVVIHPSVFEGVATEGEGARDDLLRTLTAAHDLSLIDREAGDNRGAGEILKAWVAAQSEIFSSAPQQAP